MVRERRRVANDDDRPPDWMGTYGDLITLLLAFFVMLYAMSSVDAQKFQQFVEGLAAPFGNMASAGLLAGGESMSSAQAPTTVDIAADLDAMNSIPTINGEPLGEIEEPTEEPEEVVTAEPARDEGRPELEAIEIAAALAAALEAEGLPADSAQVRPDERGVVISVASDDVLFALGSPQVSVLGKRIIKAVAKIVEELPNEVIVEGHTDDLPLRRAGYNNWNLSTDRAVAVLQLLQDHGVAPQRLVATGYGEYRPRVDNDSNKNRALNRRVDVVLVAETGD